MNYYPILFMAILFTKSFGQVDDSPEYRPVNPGEVSQKKGYDTEQIDVRRFDAKKWEEVVGGKNYLEEQPASKRKQQDKNSTSSQSSKGNKRFERGDADEDSQISDSASSSPIASPILTIVVYGLAIAIIGYILFMIIKNTSLKSKGNISKTDLPDHSTPVEDIKELEIDRLLREAMTSGNYRLVIRIYFLGLLQKLDEDGFISWKKDKTNRDYLSELFSKEHYFEEVKSLTVAYEQVWYGDHNLPLQTYEQIISSFKAVDQKLKASKPQ